MRERDKGQKGFLYDANNDKQIIKARDKAADMCFEYNNIKPSDIERQKTLLKNLIGSIKGEISIVAPFYCDYGFNISLGENFYANHNLIILDGAKVTIGDNVFIGPNCVISTAGHPIDREDRANGLEIALPINIEEDVWIGANVSILPGVRIGKGSVIGAGAVVNKDIPDDVIAGGNPCKVIRKITQADKKKYPIYEEDRD